MIPEWNNFLRYQISWVPFLLIKCRNLSYFLKNKSIINIILVIFQSRHTNKFGVFYTTLCRDVNQINKIFNLFLGFQAVIIHRPVSIFPQNVYAFIALFVFLLLLKPLKEIYSTWQTWFDELFRLFSRLFIFLYRSQIFYFVK